MSTATTTPTFRVYKSSGISCVLGGSTSLSDFLSLSSNSSTKKRLLGGRSSGSCGSARLRLCCAAGDGGGEGDDGGEGEAGDAGTMSSSDTDGDGEGGEDGEDWDEGEEDWDEGEEERSERGVQLLV